MPHAVEEVELGSKLWDFTEYNNWDLRSLYTLLEAIQMKKYYDSSETLFVSELFI